MTLPALLLIDIQNGFDDLPYWGGRRNNLTAEQEAARLLDTWRRADAPVFHIKHDSSTPNSRLAPGQHGNEIKSIVKPLGDEPVIGKNVNSAFIGTNLKERLEQQKINTVVLAGLTTDHCVSTTARMAANLGFNTIVVSDATATFDRQSETGKKFDAQLIHETALSSLNGEFATVLTTEQTIKAFHERNLAK